MRYPEDPHTLVGGVPVHIGAISLLRDLVASGHRVQLDPRDGVVIDPTDDLYQFEWALDTFDEDLALLLTLGGERLH